jgi:hypothetical protein
MIEQAFIFSYGRQNAYILTQTYAASIKIELLKPVNDSDKYGLFSCLKEQILNSQR